MFYENLQKNSKYKMYFLPVVSKMSIFKKNLYQICCTNEAIIEEYLNPDTKIVTFVKCS